MLDFLAFDEGNVSYIPESKDEKDSIQLSDDWPRIGTQSRVEVSLLPQRIYLMMITHRSAALHGGLAY